MRAKTWLSVMVALGIMLSACTSSVNPPAPETPLATEQPTQNQKPAEKPAEPQKPAPDLQLPLKPSTNGFVVRTIHQPGDELRANGLYFTDTATGQVEGWTAAHVTDVVSFYAVEGDTRWLFVWTPEIGYLADRQSQQVWQWNRKDLTVVAASGAHLLFERHDEAPDTTYLVANEKMQVLASFTGAEGPEHSKAQALFAPDGRKLVLLGHDRSLRLLDIASGEASPLGSGLPKRDGFDLVPSLSLSRDGSEIQVITMHYPGREWKPEFYTDIQRYDWKGQEAAATLTVPGTAAEISPDGKLVVYETPFQGKLPTVVIADAKTGKPQAWTRSASLCYQDDGGAGGRWLGDNSGVMLRTRMDQFQIMTVDGSLRTNSVWGTMGAEPIPSPDNPNLLALAQRELVDLAGKVVLARPKVVENQVSDLNPWMLSSKEMIFSLPHGGHGNRCGFLVELPPQVESPTTAEFDAPIRLQVNTPGDCLNLRAEPNGKVTNCLKDGTRLTVTPDKQTVPLLMIEAQLVGKNYWMHVKADSGEQGWIAVSSEFLK